MNIETGEHFVVQRGWRMGDGASSGYIYAMAMGREPPPPDTAPRYDRSWEGCVWRALEVCGEMIAGEIVHAPFHKKDCVGRREILNGGDVTLWPVTAAFVEAMCAAAVR